MPKKFQKRTIIVNLLLILHIFFFFVYHFDNISYVKSPFRSFFINDSFFRHPHQDPLKGLCTKGA